MPAFRVLGGRGGLGNDINMHAKKNLNLELIVSPP